MTKKKIFIGTGITTAAVLVLLWVFVFKGAGTTGAVEAAVNLQGVKAVPGSVAIKVEGPSVAEPYRTQTIRSAIEGVVTFSRGEGETVEKDDILVTLDESDKRISLQQSEINLSKAQLNRDKSKDLLQKALVSLEGKKKLFTEGALSEDQVDEAQAAADNAEYLLKSAELDLSQARLALELAKKDLNSTKIRAPFSGVVINGELVPGDMVSKGAPLVTIADISRIRLTAEVDEFDIGKVEKGQRVSITSDSLGDKILTSKVDSISPAAEVVNNISIFKVSAVTGNTSGILKPGMSADISILIKSDKGLIVPSKAVSHIRTRSYIKVLENNKVKTKKITTGADNGINIVVLDGLNEGDVVVFEQPAGFSLTGAGSSTSGSTGNSVIPISIPGVRK